MAVETHLPAIASVIQLAVAPVFLLTAVGTIIAALNYRLGRAVDRRRSLERRLAKMDEEELGPARDELATIALPEAVETLSLAAGETRLLAARNHSLFAGDPADPEERWRIIEHLRARLGAEAVYGLEIFPDHRPELAFRKTRLSGKLMETPPHHAWAEPYRPLWLLPRPLPLKASENLPQRNGPLTLLDGPERIESGWWDDFDVRRDYFIARDESGAKLWIFKQRTGGEEWFIHGVFG